MNSKIILGIIAAIILCFALYFFASRDKGPAYYWEPTYEAEENHVYGTSIFKKLLIREDRKLTDVEGKLQSTFEEDAIEQNYVFIGPALFLDSLDVKAMLNFVDLGNIAFISSESISEKLMDELFVSCHENWYWYDYQDYYNDTLIFSLEHEDLDFVKTDNIFYHSRDSMNRSISWSYIPDSLVCNKEGEMVCIGRDHHNRINFVKQNYGNGVFYFHTSPLVFTNMHLMRDANLPYVNAIQNHLASGDILWDDFNRVSKMVGQRMNNRNQISSDGPMKYVLQKPAFRWAWYLLLSLAILYVVFRAKRTQRIIPVSESNKNTSLEFISTIGSMYFQQNDNRKLCKEQMRLFLADIRQRHRVRTRTLDTAFVSVLANKTEVPEQLINKILKYNQNIEKSDFVSENTMVEFYQLINQFEKIASK